ncbi:acetyl-CoA acetyltransferase [uncultured Sneathiella sp.]|uniref:acetyl-CoA acetyltransferase n=1 Tax=uncultured Sneathiella sp. TaxID=879315 RepID=UPI0025957B59|nr:acetyl-CoA acetyltransferase [uncultured Sneathiella sp.]
MKYNTPVIVGVADLPLENGKFAGGENVLQAQAKAALAALDDAGLKMSDVDGLLTSGVWGLNGPGVLMPVTVGEYLGITPRFMDSTNIGGSVFEAQLGHASLAIQSGQCEIALIVYGSAQRSARARSFGGRPTDLNFQYDVPYGLANPIGTYALATMRYMHETGAQPEDLAEVAVSARRWAQLNDAAFKRDDLTIADVLNSPQICDPLHAADCCLVTDGAGAVIVTTSERAKDLKSQPIEVLGFGEAQASLLVSEMEDLCRLLPAEMSSKRAIEMAGVSLTDIDVMQLYDSFTITVLLTLEAIGVCQRGEAAQFVRNGRIAPGGAFPINTGGGGLSNMHPGMFGIFLIIEAVRQLRGECGFRQVDDARLALVHGTGGYLSSGATCILGRA